MDPIRVGIQGNALADYFEGYVLHQIEGSRNLTGHPIELYYSYSKLVSGKLPDDFDPRQVNLIIYSDTTAILPKLLSRYFDNDEQKVRTMMTTDPCLAKWFTQKSAIVSAVAAIPNDLPEHLALGCIVEGFARILGLPDETSEKIPSIFNAGEQTTELTDHDCWMVRMLYDPRITPGMPREEAMRVGREILREIRPEGE